MALGVRFAEKVCGHAPRALLTQTPEHALIRDCTLDGYKIDSLGGVEVVHFGGLGGPGGPGDPCKGWGEAPHLLEGSQGPPGRPDPQNDRFPTFTKSKIPSQSTATQSRLRVTHRFGSAPGVPCCCNTLVPMSSCANGCSPPAWP